jgi:hypothetical protein
MTRTVSPGSATTVAAYGLRATLPKRWEARLYRRTGSAEEGESTNPVLHVANFALPARRGDFGSGAVEIMRSHDAFVALLEYDSSETGRALFAARGLPRPALTEFAPNALQRKLPGQLGYQGFCTENGRAFCLYVVLGSWQHARQLLDEVHDAVDCIEVEPR